MIRIILSSAIALIFAGCSHNAITYSDGVGLETTIRPDTGTFGFNFRYGKILTAVVRENSEVKMTGDASANTSTSPDTKTGASGSVNVKIGKQWNGYLVDAIKASNNSDLAKNYFSDAGNKTAETKTAEK